MKVCSVIGCGRKVQARGWCNTHYWHAYVGREPGGEGRNARAVRLRAEAKAAGAATYASERPCPKGHDLVRSVASGRCVVCARELSTAQRNRNPERSRAAVAAWTERNRERMREIVRAWDSANRDKKSEHSAKRRAAEIQAMPDWADRRAIKAIYAKASETEMEVDHIVPLQGALVCGLHVAENLQLLPAAANRSKSNKFAVDEVSA